MMFIQRADNLAKLIGMRIILTSGSTKCSNVMHHSPCFSCFLFEDFSYWMHLHLLFWPHVTCVMTFLFSVVTLHWLLSFMHSHLKTEADIGIVLFHITCREFTCFYILKIRIIFVVQDFWCSAYNVHQKPSRGRTKNTWWWTIHYAALHLLYGQKLCQTDSISHKWNIISLIWKNHWTVKYSSLWLHLSWGPVKLPHYPKAWHLKLWGKITGSWIIGSCDLITLIFRSVDGTHWLNSPKYDIHPLKKSSTYKAK